MNKRRLIEEIANNTYYCKLEHFKDIAYHELRHMGLDPK